MKNYDVAGMGSCLVDYIVLVPKLAGPDEKINVDGDAHVECGGATICNLVQSARLGLKSVWLGKIGDDRNGRIILDAFQEEGMGREAIVVPGASSAYTWIPVDKDGERCIYIFSNITHTLTAQEVRDRYTDIIGSARIFHTEIGVLGLDAVLEGLRIAKKAGVTTLVDLDVDVDIFIHANKRGRPEQVGELLSLCDILKGSCHHAMDYTKKSTPAEAAKAVLARGPRMVALTHGSKGSYLLTEKEAIEQPIFKVQAIDSTGAGDAFTGGLSFGVLQGWPLAKTAEFASACGAYCCLRVGAQQSGSYQDVVSYFHLWEYGRAEN